MADNRVRLYPCFFIAKMEDGVRVLVRDANKAITIPYHEELKKEWAEFENEHDYNRHLTVEVSQQYAYDNELLGTHTTRTGGRPSTGDPT